jgi:hypothetical protein
VWAGESWVNKRMEHTEDAHNLYSYIIVKVSSIFRKFISRVSMGRHAVWMGGKGDEMRERDTEF